MAQKSSSGIQHKEGVPKRTSVGQGRRKSCSWKIQRKKPMRGQGKG